MTTKTITTYISAGYTLSATYSALKITSTGGVGGVGLVANSAAHVDNYGVVNGKTATGIALNAGGSVLNRPGGMITGLSTGVQDTAGYVTNYGTLKSGGDPIRFTSAASSGTVTNGSYGLLNSLIMGTGIYFAGSGTVSNFATIQSRVTIAKGGRVSNGAVGDQTALIAGQVIFGAAGTLFNFGTVAGSSNTGVFISGGGTVTNGGATATAARISGFYGVEISGAAGAVTNFGTIASNRVLVAAAGVKLLNGGSLSNGTALDPGALIEGYNGAYMGGVAGTAKNFGTILGQGVGAGEYGLRLRAGGKAVNGGAGDAAALIEGANGVGMTAVGTVVNYGTIAGATAAGVLLNGGGSVANLGVIRAAGDGVSITSGVVTNGGGADRSALIAGYDGVVGGAATVRNFGTVLGSNVANTAGVKLDFGTLFNGSLNNSAALIAGETGVSAYGGAVTNFGTLQGLADYNTPMDFDGYGAVIDGGANLTNGAAGHTGAVIKGLAGLTALYENNTVTNYGVIEGYNGVAVNLRGNLDTLVVEAGSAFIGSVYGGLGHLELAGGVGTLTGLFVGGDVTVSGSMAPTTFQNFDALVIDGPASFTAAGGGDVDASRTLNVNGTLTTAGALSVEGELNTRGTLAGTGTLAVSGGTAAFNAGTSLTIARVTVSGATTAVTIGAPLLTYAGQWTQTAGTLSVAAADRINFSGVGDSFAGTLTGAGTIGFTGGSDTLAGTALSAASMIISTATVTLSGAISLTTTLSVTTPHMIVAAAGATLSGGGTLALSNTAANAVTGASASATLTNSDKINGGGQLGGGVMTLVNQAGGVINGNLATALIVNTGAKTITNAGIIEATSSGGLTLASAVANTGSLVVTAGVLTIEGAVTGTGTVRIGGGTADVATSTFTQNVTFTSSAGVLELADSVGYTGTISGFSKTGTTSLDLLDIGFASGTTTATFSGTTTSGVLTVTDGAHTAKITLAGNYTAATFVVSSDTHGGTSVVDPTAAPTGRTPPMLPLVNAMAGFGRRGGAAAGPSAFAQRPQFTVLARPA